MDSNVPPRPNAQYEPAHIIGPKREKVWRRDSRDYDLYIDGEYVGCARTADEADSKINALIYDRLTYQAERDVLALSARYKAARANGDMEAADHLKRQGKTIQALLAYVRGT